MHFLDDDKKMKALDPEGMLQAIQDLPAQVESCWAQIKKFSIPTHYIKAKNVVILGMGGSAVGGGLLCSLLSAKSKLPIYVHKDYDLPGFVNSESLVIAVSYSGNTEETLSGAQKAGEVGAKIVGISTGGMLGSICRKYKAPMFEINYGAQPRAALGYLFVSILGILHKLGFVGIGEEEIPNTVLLMKALEAKIHPGIQLSQNQAKQLALRLKDRVPLIIASGTLSEVARRWKTQINENAKQLAFSEILPEANHNMVMGLDFPKKIIEQIMVVMLQSKFDHARVKIRQQVTLQILQQKKIQYETVYQPVATTALEEMFLAIFLGDYVSFYLAMINGVDPTKIESINYLKERLSASK